LTLTISIGSIHVEYLDALIELLKEVRETQGQMIARAAEMVADALAADHLIYVFGPTHAGIVAQELFYRAGGLVPVNPILPPGLTCDVRPITFTTRLERMPGYGSQIIAASAIGPGDVLIVASVSGRNAVAVEVAQGGKARGAAVIALTSLQYSRSVTPRQAGQPRLYEVADLVLDNRAPVGDALIALPGLHGRVGPSSTVTGTAILNAVVVRAVALLQQRGIEAPVFVSANVEGGYEHNSRWLERYKGRLTYL
jgi:uncharacterized phosphosugar-binding protein